MIGTTRRRRSVPVKDWRMLAWYRLMSRSRHSGCWGMRVSGRTPMVCSRHDCGTGWSHNLSQHVACPTSTHLHLSAMRPALGSVFSKVSGSKSSPAALPFQLIPQRSQEYLLYSLSEPNSSPRWSKERARNRSIPRCWPTSKVEKNWSSQVNRSAAHGRLQRPAWRSIPRPW